MITSVTMMFTRIEYISSSRARLASSMFVMPESLRSTASVRVFSHVLSHVDCKTKPKFANVNAMSRVLQD